MTMPKNVISLSEMQTAHHRQPLRGDHRKEILRKIGMLQDKSGQKVHQIAHVDGQIFPVHHVDGRTAPPGNGRIFNIIHDQGSVVGNLRQRGQYVPGPAATKGLTGEYRHQGSPALSAPAQKISPGFKKGIRPFWTCFGTVLSGDTGHPAGIHSIGKVQSEGVFDAGDSF
jgi:hypothetical protein